ncbi:hypothetical protein [Desulfovibrio litoralis]|uniref:Uncharacterized protein n=1 Tax=Desulfovibrio litoralis DSM 11393 TaxID=1121455 RepID=A0A1M7RU64_9BACT|nr:hypothetical protein [Desulfovibrio litoralis]SHN49867.1 hypothetical protein SAMN02745728_00179 [Desulfovibrio litoralis DSM 11393]
MNTYKMRYIHGPQEHLISLHEHEVKAESVKEALRLKSAWPIHLNMYNNCGWAQKPGNSIYYIEAWEAEQVV